MANLLDGFKNPWDTENSGFNAMQNEALQAMQQMQEAVLGKSALQTNVFNNNEELLGLKKEDNYVSRPGIFTSGVTDDFSYRLRNLFDNKIKIEFRYAKDISRYQMIILYLSDEQLLEKGLSPIQINAYKYLHKNCFDPNRHVDLGIMYKKVNKKVNGDEVEYDVQSDSYYLNYFYPNRVGIEGGKEDDFEGLGSLGVNFLHYIEEQAFSQNEAKVIYNRPPNESWETMGPNQYLKSHDHTLNQQVNIVGITWYPPSDWTLGGIAEEVTATINGKPVIQTIHTDEANIFGIDNKYIKTVVVKTNINTGKIEYSDYKKEGEIIKPMQTGNL